MSPTVHAAGVDVVESFTENPFGTTSRVQPHLIVSVGTRCEIHTLRSSELTRIGRSGKNDIVVTHEKASRRHCEVLNRSGKWYLRDLDSRNGTRLNGSRIIGEEPLFHGDIIEVAKTQITFTVEAGAVEDEHLSGDTINCENEQTEMVSRDEGDSVAE